MPKVLLQHWSYIYVFTPVFWLFCSLQANYLTQDSILFSLPCCSRNKWKWKRCRKTWILKDDSLRSVWQLAKGRRRSLKRSKPRFVCIIFKENFIDWLFPNFYIAGFPCHVCHSKQNKIKVKKSSIDKVQNLGNEMR